MHSSEEINTPTPSRTYLPTMISIQCKLGRLLTHCSKGTLKPPHTMKCGPKAYLVSYNIPNTNIDIDVKYWADFRDWDMLMRNLIRLTVHSRTPGVDLSFLQIILMNYQSSKGTEYELSCLCHLITLRIIAKYWHIPPSLACRSIMHVKQIKLPRMQLGR